MTKIKKNYESEKSEENAKKWKSYKSKNSLRIVVTTETIRFQQNFHQFLRFFNRIAFEILQWH